MFQLSYGLRFLYSPQFSHVSICVVRAGNASNDSNREEHFNPTGEQETDR